MLGEGRPIYSTIKGRFGNQLFQFWGAAWVAACLGRPLFVKFTRDCYLDTPEFPNMRSFVQLDELPSPPQVQLQQQQRGGKAGRGKWRGQGRGQGMRVAAGGHRHVYKYGMAHGPSSYDPDLIVAEERGSPDSATADVHMAAYNETYRFVRKHEAWIRSMFVRRCMHLGALPVLAVHLRLGDLADKYEPSLDAYAAFAAKVARDDPVASRQPVVLVVSEDPAHPRTAHLVQTIRRAISSSSRKSAITSAKASANAKASATRRTVVVHGHAPGVDEVQADFDVFYRASAIVMNNSTFTWWPAFLNPFDPAVFVGLSESQPFSGARNREMFVDGPAGWHVQDLDNFFSDGGKPPPEKK